MITVWTPWNYIWTDPRAWDLLIGSLLGLVFILATALLILATKFMLDTPPKHR